MTQRLKRWESPRRQGRNDRGKGGSARARQLRKQQQMLRQKLKSSPENKQDNSRGGSNILPLVLSIAVNNTTKREQSCFYSKLKVKKLSDQIFGGSKQNF
jgi:hypothetical protein